MRKKNTFNKLAKKRLIIETMIFISIVISPFVFNLHEYLPTDPEAEIKIFWFSIDNHGFADVSTYAWFMLTKLVPLYLITLWFFTCKEWWYHSILIPLMMYAFQIFEGIFSNDRNVDTENILWLLPVCMVVIPFVYFIRIKLYDKHVHGIDLEAIDAELKAYKEKEELKNGNTPRNDPQTDNQTVAPSENTSSGKLDQFIAEFQGKVERLFDIKL
ncbi:hypothetical protein U1E44_04705 [Arenibacter sp. GZD96]|uniref:hypothetical protein n=1 Tax=Aurantibrevibacter litoralis TaxID=3106030 RepID=UPI002AFE5ACA|nr:hypothetical protein [Arenibacter sp. GZD-96]MEA1785383.1 hypothetical protein [Arenibacter sp. GZD-96]